MLIFVKKSFLQQKKFMQNDIFRLQHMLESISKIEDFLDGFSSESELVSDDKTLSAVERQFEILGEAANYLSVELKEKHSEIPWHEINGLRNILAHKYFGINASVLWNAYLEDLPPLKKFLENYLKNHVKN
jgi:uncharacterized protein with HEPN domain